MSVRRATEADRETLYALWDEWVAAESPPPPWVDRAREGTRAGIDTAVREGATAMYEEDGEPVGFACAVMVGPRTADLTELYVRPMARGRGIAKELMRLVLAQLRELGAEWVTGGVALNNASARRFYERAGFRAESLTLIGQIDALERAAAAQNEP